MNYITLPLSGMTGIAFVLVMFIGVSAVAVFYFNKYRRMRLLNGRLCHQLKLQEKMLHKVSREIHENICQGIVLARLKLDGFETPSLLNEMSPRDLLKSAINDLRDLGRELEAGFVSDVGLDEAIKNELALVSRSAHFRTTLKQRGRRFRFDQQKEVVVFRLFQELMADINKRDDAKTVNVRLLYRPHLFNLMVCDDGDSFDEDRANGILTMQTRAELIGANFHFSSTPGKGNSVSIDIPFDKTMDKYE